MVPHRLEKGFIKAEVISVDDLIAAGSVLALLTVLNSAHGPLRRDMTGLPPIPLPAVILEIAVLTRFSAPWTPQGLYTALYSGAEWSTRPATTRTVLSHGSDAYYEGRRTAQGTWTVSHVERGTARVVREGLDDDAYVQMLLTGRRGTPFPYGWRSHDVPGFTDVIDGAVNVRDKWNQSDARLPYLEGWITTRNARADPDYPTV